MNPIFKKAEVFLVAGPGGVGKTTLSAALGMALASQGFKTIVLTVDPAKRLANALGLELFDHEVQEIPIVGNMLLFASQLDSQRYFDRLIERFSRTPQQKEKILINPLYRAMVDTLGGTHEYAAMERLLEFVETKSYEKIVVDTPPTQNAVDLLNAPERLADFMDSSVLKWFGGTKPYYVSLFRQGTRLAMKMLRRIFGSEFLETFGKFLDDLEGMHAGFRKRNLEVLELLRGPTTAVLVVNTASETRYLETRAFLQTLGEQRIQVAMLILNRLEPLVSSELPNGFEAPEKETAYYLGILQHYHSLYVVEQWWVERFEGLRPDLDLVRIEQWGEFTHPKEVLLRLGKQLLFFPQPPTDC